MLFVVCVVCDVCDYKMPLLAYESTTDRRAWIFEKTKAEGWTAITIIRNLNACIQMLVADINRTTKDKHAHILKQIADVSADINWFCLLPTTRL